METTGRALPCLDDTWTVRKSYCGMWAQHAARTNTRPLSERGTTILKCTLKE